MEGTLDEEELAGSKFLSFANEIIEFIFNLSLLDHRDICHLAQTCHRFSDIANSKEVWRVKANQRWKIWKYRPSTESNWKDIYKRRLNLERDLLKKIGNVIKKSYKKDCLPNKDLISFANFCDEKDEEDIQQIHNVLHSMVFPARYKNLTLKFYARKVYVFVKQHLLKKKWCTYLCRPEEEQRLMKGAILIAKWCAQLKDIDEAGITRKLDEIVLLVKEKVAVVDKRYNEKGSKPSKDFITLEAIQETLFKDIGFHGNKRSYYDVNNSFIDKVLELRTGIPITLATVFSAVTDRFGIQTEPVNFPTHFLLRYSSHSSSHHHKYIDAFNGRIMDELDCIQILPYESRNTIPRKALFPTASPRQVFTRMVANIINTHRSSTNIDGRSLDKLRSALELMLLLNPDDEEHRLMLSRIYLHHGVNLDEVVNNLRQLSSSTRSSLQTGLLASLLGYAIERRDEEHETAIVPKYRSDAQNSNVLYRVGMIMHHRRYHYFCVIYGWDNFCNMEESWRIQMGVYNLSFGAEQPFYNVLADDGSSRYASQENLVPLNKTGSRGRPIPHQDIGKYFDEFNGLYYKPNSFLAQSYPEDGEIPCDLLPSNPCVDMNETESMDESC